MRKIRLTESELTNIVKRVIEEGIGHTLKGGKIKGSGDSHPDLKVIEKETGTVELKQEIGDKTHKILLSPKQVKELKDIL